MTHSLWTNLGITVVVLVLSFHLYHWLHKPNERSKITTWRIRNISRSLTKNRLQSALEESVGETTKIRGPDVEILQLSLAPSTERYSIATVTFPYPSPNISAVQHYLRQRSDLHDVTVDVDFLDITPLYESDVSHPSKIDIVAVSGLASHGLGSWKEPEGYRVWLRDFLPEDIPDGLRILTYGYNTDLLNSENNSSIRDLAKVFLSRLKSARSYASARHRPIIFIGHSLGGLVIKEALVIAGEDKRSQPDYEIFKCTYALMMFGVPNLGLRNEPLNTLVNGQPKKDLVRSLVVLDNSQPSHMLEVLHDRFRATFRDQNLEVMSYYETINSPTIEISELRVPTLTGPSILMVPKPSATYAGSVDKFYNQQPINANHSKMVKFSDQSDGDYRSVMEKIKHWTEEAPQIVKGRFTPQGLSKDQQNCWRDLNQPPYREIRDSKIDEPAGDTLQWLNTEPGLKKWRDNDGPRSLYIRGSPGQGKSVLTKAIVAQLEKSIKGPDVAVLYYFCYNQDPDFRTPSSVLQALIVQLLEVPEMFHHLPRTFQDKRSEFVSASLANLWDVFHNMISDRHYRKIYCVIDALDECEDPQGEFCLRLSNMNVHYGNTDTQTTPILKTLISSRPGENHIERNFRNFHVWDLEANQRDLSFYTQIKLAELSGDLSEHMNIIKENLTRRRGRSFLWISSVLKELAQVQWPTIQRIRNIIDDTPTELGLIYQRIINRLKDDEAEDVLKLLLWITYAKKPLMVQDLEVAIALDLRREYRSTQQIRNYKPNLTSELIRKRAGALVEVDCGSVYFIHQSVKDTLLKNNVLHPLEFLHRESSPDLYLSRLCMEFLDSEAWKGDYLEVGQRRGGFSCHGFLESLSRMVDYAAESWFRHVSCVHELSNVMLNYVDLLISPEPGHTRAWLKVLKGKFELLRIRFRRDECFLLSVAIAFRSDWMTEYILESGKLMLYEMELREVMCCNVSGRHVIFAMVLNAWEKHNVDKKRVPDKVVELMARKGRPSMIKLLLEHKAIPLATDKVSVAAADVVDGEIMFPPQRKSEDVLISERILMAAIRNIHGDKVLRLLLERNKQPSLITEDIAKLAVKSHHNAMEKVTMILDHSEHPLAIIQGIIKAAVQRYDKPLRMVTLLLDRCESTITITSDILKAALRSHDAVELSALLVDRCGSTITITSEILKAVLRCNDAVELLTLLLNQCESTFSITEDVILCAFETSQQVLQKLKVLLNSSKMTFFITAKMLEAAMKFHPDDIMQIMTLFLDRCESISSMKDTIISAYRSAFLDITPELVTPLLNRLRGSESTLPIVKDITMSVFETSNYGVTTELVTLLIDRCESPLPITEDMMDNMMCYVEEPVQIATLLLSRCQFTGSVRGVTIEAALHNRNFRQTLQIVTLLLDLCEFPSDITEYAMVAAVDHPYHSLELVQLLVERGSKRNQFAETVVQQAVWSHKSELIILLRDRLDFGLECYCNLWKFPWERIAKFKLTMHDGDKGKMQQLLVDGFEDGKTPLWVAARFGDSVDLKALLDLNIFNMESRSIGENDTALYVAVAFGSCTCAKLLLERGADPDAECGRGFKSLPQGLASLNYGRSLERWIGQRPDL